MPNRAAMWPKRCRCGACWSRETWATLGFVGHADGGEDGELELRNCQCGSTLAVQCDVSDRSRSVSSSS